MAESERRTERRQPISDSHDRDGLDPVMTLQVAAGAHRSMDMALAPGGRMRQEIYDVPNPFDVWDTRKASRCFVHLTNAYRSEIPLLRLPAAAGRPRSAWL